MAPLLLQAVRPDLKVQLFQRNSQNFCGLLALAGYLLKGLVDELPFQFRQVRLRVLIQGKPGTLALQAGWQVF
jgi:hypothetical protein